MISFSKHLKYIQDNLKPRTHVTDTLIDVKSSSAAANSSSDPFSITGGEQMLEISRVSEELDLALLDENAISIFMPPASYTDRKGKGRAR